ncbi:MAG: hypothetical protein GX610_01285, partial [Rhodococcus sp.]|nr:hypothetical protein [Rhodococcus sp. (in: high G+C Gram-positive bacteria)]
MRRHSLVQHSIEGVGIEPGEQRAQGRRYRLSSLIAVDDKTIRGARTAAGRSPHLVATVTHEDVVVLGQWRTADKSNE